MKTYIAKWENGTISIVTAHSKNELLLKLDSEGDVRGAKLFEVPPSEDGGFHIATSLEKNDDDVAINFYAGEYSEPFKKVSYKF